MSEILVGGFVRLVQSLASCSPTLFVGLFIAAVLRYYFGSEATKRLFGGESIRSLPQSWLIGMLLPVCSIGVIPILFELRRSGVRAGAMTAFALSAPLFNPLSLLYGLTLSRPLVIIAFAMLSLVVVTVLGMIWDRFAGPKSEDGMDNGKRAVDREEVIGTQRLWLVVRMIGYDLTGWVGLLALIACAGPMVMAMILPHGALQSSVEQMDPMSPVRMMLAAVPVYATPMLTMSQLGMMFQHANSPGAALVLLMLGTGMNLATLAWLGTSYGVRPTMIWLASLLLVVMCCAYAVDRPLIPQGVEPAGHTHAFDIYTNPFPHGSNINLRVVREAIERSLGIGEIISVIILIPVVVISAAAKLWGPRQKLASAEASSQSPSFSQETAVPYQAGRRRYDVIVPPATVGFVMLIVLVAFSIVGCFAYYPHPDETLEEIRIARTEALSGANSMNTDHALHWIGVWDDWSRRLEVGVFLRTGTVRPYQRMQGYLLRKKLELLEHELEHDPLEPHEVKLVAEDLMRSHQRFVRAFAIANN